MINRAGCSTQRPGACDDNLTYYPKTTYTYVGASSKYKSKYQFDPVDGTSDQWYISFWLDGKRLYWDVYDGWIIVSETPNSMAWRIKTFVDYEYLWLEFLLMPHPGGNWNAFSIQNVDSSEYVTMTGPGWLYLRDKYPHPWRFWPDLY